MKNRRLVIVTGATGTIGSEICIQLTKSGYYVVAVTRNAKRGEQLIHTLGATQACHLALDVSSARDMDVLFADSIFDNGTLAAVVTCAGALKMGPTANFCDNEWHRIVSLNTSGTFYIFRRALKKMETQAEGGMLIAIGSRWDCGAKQAAAYSASKAALRGLITSLQKELAGSAIRPVLISPGSVESPMSSSVNNCIGKEILKSSDIAELVTYVLSTPQRVIFNEITIQAYNFDFNEAYYE